MTCNFLQIHVTTAINFDWWKEPLDSLMTTPKRLNLFLEVQDPNLRRKKLSITKLSFAYAKL